MVIGIPRESHHLEHRVGLNPFVVSRLAQHGHDVLIERGAGDAAHFSDQDYTHAGGQIVYSADEVYQRGDLICRVERISEDELDLLKPGSCICAFQHLAVAPREVVGRLMELETTLIGYEIICDRHGEMPVLIPISDMAGQLSVHTAAYLLQNENQGRGILLGNVPGVPPPTVLILGAGPVGYAAATKAVASGAHVIILDTDVRRLRAVSQMVEGPVVTAMAADERLEQFTAICDVLIGAVNVPGGRTPFLVSEEMVARMKPGSVIIDVAVDQGGCVETTRPTQLDNPTFVLHDVLHYCVPNMTSNVARTASRALANAALPYLLRLTEKGLAAALRDSPGLYAGVYLYRGKMVNEAAARTLGIDAQPLGSLLGQDGAA